MAAKITTPPGVGSFPTLFEPKAYEEGKEKKYSIQVIFGKDADLSEMKKAYKDLLTEKFGKKIPKHNSPFRDPADKEGKPEYEGCQTFVTFSGSYKPKVIGTNKDDVITEDSERMYGGCIVRVSTKPYWYDFRGNKGVAFGLGNVQKIRDGERLGSSYNVEEDFDELDVEDLELADSIYAD